MAGTTPSRKRKAGRGSGPVPPPPADGAASAPVAPARPAKRQSRANVGSSPGSTPSREEERVGENPAGPAAVAAAPTGSGSAGNAPAIARDRTAATGTAAATTDGLVGAAAGGRRRFPQKSRGMRPEPKSKSRAGQRANEAEARGAGEADEEVRRFATAEVEAEREAEAEAKAEDDKEEEAAAAAACQCAVCFQSYNVDQLTTLPCCGLVRSGNGSSNNDGNNNNGNEDELAEDSTERSSTTRFCPTCLITLATHESTNNSYQTIAVDPTTALRTNTFGHTHCRIGECPRCSSVLTITGVRPYVGMGATFSETITAEFGWTVDDLLLREAGLGDIVRYACGPRALGAGGGNGQGQARRQQLEQQVRWRIFQNQMEIIADIVGGGGAGGMAAAAAAAGGGRGGRGGRAGRGNANANANAGGRGGAGGGRGAAGNAAPAPANAANAANGAATATATATTGPYYHLFSFLAHTPTPRYIPGCYVSRNTLEELFPKLVRWGILTEIKRGRVFGRAFALREPVAETQALLRAALPSMLFDPALNPRAGQNAERLENLQVRPGLAALQRPEDMDAAVHQSMIAANSFASALLCLADLRPAMALFLTNEGMTAFWVALGIIPGRNGGPPMNILQRALVADVNLLFVLLAVRGVFGVLHEAARTLPLAVSFVSLAGAVLSEHPPRKWALAFVLYFCYSWAKTPDGHLLYLLLHLLWNLALPKKSTMDAPYWLYGLLFAEVLVGYFLYPADLPKIDFGSVLFLAKKATSIVHEVVVASLGGR